MSDQYDVIIKAKEARSKIVTMIKEMQNVINNEDLHIDPALKLQIEHFITMIEQDNLPNEQELRMLHDNILTGLTAAVKITQQDIDITNQKIVELNTEINQIEGVSG